MIGHRSLDDNACAVSSFWPARAGCSLNSLRACCARCSLRSGSSRWALSALNSLSSGISFRACWAGRSYSARVFPMHRQIRLRQLGQLLRSGRELPAGQLPRAGLCFQLGQEFPVSLPGLAAPAGQSRERRQPAWDCRLL